MCQLWALGRAESGTWEPAVVVAEPAKVADFRHHSTSTAGSSRSNCASVARVAQMALIEDHTRLQRLPEENTNDLQFQLLPITDPDEWTDYVAHTEAAQATDEDRLDG
jgi:hypothetical protein